MKNTRDGDRIYIPTYKKISVQKLEGIGFNSEVEIIDFGVEYVPREINHVRLFMGNKSVLVEITDIQSAISETIARQRKR